MHRAGIADGEADDVVLAIDEACQNVIRHAYCDDDVGDIEISIRLEDGALIVDLRDFADPVDPDCVKGERDLEEVRPGGLGTHFMRSVMDDVEFIECTESGNWLRMRKHLSGAS